MTKNIVYVAVDLKGNTIWTESRIEANNTAYHAQTEVAVYDRDAGKVINQFKPYKVLLTPANDFHCHELKGGRVKTY